MPSPYPKIYQIEEMIANREIPDTFHTYFADSVDINVVGQDSHIGGHYNSTQAFHDNIYARTTAALNMETVRLDIKRVIGGEFADLVRFNSQGKIAQLKEFYDSGHIQPTLKEHDGTDEQAK